ncbi:MAG: FG-GAP repeat protein [Leptospiraceae bacterium]|nr:FG-GAP repeat protein [Leptospiraceae bacterium]MCK6381411.1 FG-GAP repeat protein [Leptospiraceae bacterium]
MVIGAYGRNAGAGAAQGVVYVFHSAGSSGVTITAAASASTIIAGTSSSDTFSYSVSMGDVNGDGYADVTVGAYARNAGIVGQGVAYIFHSTGSSGVTTTAATSANSTIIGTSTNDYFGFSVF